MTASFHFKKTSPKLTIFDCFFVHSKCKLSSLRSQFCKMRPFCDFQTPCTHNPTYPNIRSINDSKERMRKNQFFPQSAVSESDRVLAFQIVVSDRRASIEDHDLGSTNTSSSDTTRSSLISWNCCYPRNQVSNEESRLNHLYEHQTRIPDIEVNSTQSSVNFLNSSGGSLLLSDAIREARRTR